MLADGYPGDGDTVQPACLLSRLPMELSRDGIRREYHCRTNQGENTI